MARWPCCCPCGAGAETERAGADVGATALALAFSCACDDAAAAYERPLVRLPFGIAAPGCELVFALLLFDNDADVEAPDGKFRRDAAAAALLLSDETADMGSGESVVSSSKGDDGGGDQLMASESAMMSLHSRERSRGAEGSGQ